MNIIKPLFILILTSVFLTGCVSQRIKRTPFKQVKLPPLTNNKSRIIFHHAGNIYVPGKIINANNDKILTILGPSECTYIDVKVGTYQFQAGHHSLGPNELVTELSVVSGKTYYMIWWWNRDRHIGFHGSERGSHFMNLKPEQGKKMVSYCNYKETVLKEVVLKQ